MKKLKKLKLSDNVEVLNNTQMKMIVGGDKTGYPEGSSPKIEACKGKDLCAPCSWEYKGTWNSGKCSQNAFDKYRYCSTLNCHT